MFFNVEETVLLIPPANCGAPPSRNSLFFVLAGPHAMNSTGALVVNPEATATYRCVDPDLILMGTGLLSCAFMGDMAVQWTPTEAPECIEGKGSTRHMALCRPNFNLMTE